jgi:serine/threonine-protein kinase HipA
MNGERVGTWTTTRAATHKLTYEPSWVESPRGRPLSLSLPFTADPTLVGNNVAHFFDNLLPDSRAIRQRVGKRLGVNGDDSFELLTAIGRDCVGAVQLLPPEATPDGFDQVNGTRLTPEQVEQHLLGVTVDPPFAPDENADDAWRISLAGAQEKTALLRINDDWYLPSGATPSTHILKLPLGLVGNQRADMRDSVYNEWLCLTLLEALGLPAAHSEVLTFGSQTVLCVERFDRRWFEPENASPWIVRLPQEDMCQALGLPPDQKYEVTDARGRTSGPTMDMLLGLLKAGDEPVEDASLFLLAQLMFWVLGNTDGHGKNFSLFLQPGQTYAMTPLYDVISLWPMVGDAPSQMRSRNMSLAIALRARKVRRKLDDIHGADWVDAARRHGLPDLPERMLALLQAVPEALAQTLAHRSDDFPPRLLDKMQPCILQRAAQAAAEITSA